jgi:hypothetical protein
MVDRIIEDLCKEVAFETYKINESAKTLSIIVVMKALKIERGFGKSEKEMQGDFFSLRGADLKKVNDLNGFKLEEKRKVQVLLQR